MLDQKLLLNPKVKEIVLAFLKYHSKEMHPGDDYDEFVGQMDIKAKMVKETQEQRILQLVEKMREVVPDHKCHPSGKNLRSPTPDLIHKLKGFLKKYNKDKRYTPAIILEATRMYGVIAERRDFQSTSPLNYFIEKDGISHLADLCEQVINGQTIKAEPIVEFKSGLG